jgi:hypothetical protein
MVNLSIRCTLNGYHKNPRPEAFARALREIAERQQSTSDHFDLLLMAEAMDPQGKTRRKLTIQNRKRGRPKQVETALQQDEDVRRFESYAGDGRNRKWQMHDVQEEFIDEEGKRKYKRGRSTIYRSVKEEKKHAIVKENLKEYL